MNPKVATYELVVDLVGQRGKAQLIREANAVLQEWDVLPESAKRAEYDRSKIEVKPDLIDGIRAGNPYRLKQGEYWYAKVDPRYPAMFIAMERAGVELPTDVESLCAVVEDRQRSVHLGDRLSDDQKLALYRDVITPRLPAASAFGPLVRFVNLVVRAAGLGRLLQAATCVQDRRLKARSSDVDFAAPPLVMDLDSGLAAPTPPESLRQVLCRIGREVATCDVAISLDVRMRLWEVLEDTASLSPLTNTVLDELSAKIEAALG